MNRFELNLTHLIIGFKKFGCFVDCIFQSTNKWFHEKCKYSLDLGGQIRFSNYVCFESKLFPLIKIYQFFFFFNVGPPKEDIFSGHLLSPVFQSITHITITGSCLLGRSHKIVAFFAKSYPSFFFAEICCKFLAFFMFFAAKTLVEIYNTYLIVTVDNLPTYLLALHVHEPHFTTPFF